MLRANKEAVMTVLDTLNFVAFNPLQNNNPIAVRRRKLMAKIDEQIQLATNKDYTPTQHKWVTDDEGKQTKVEVAKRVKPSVGKLAICASKLQHYGRCMTATEAHTQLGNRFIELS